WIPASHPGRVESGSEFVCPAAAPAATSSNAGTQLVLIRLSLVLAAIREAARHDIARRPIAAAAVPVPSPGTDTRLLLCHFACGIPWNREIIPKTVRLSGEAQRG